MKRHRSVLSRLERVKRLQSQGVLDMGQSSFLGLPKVKHLKIRVKKEKAVASETTEVAGTGAGAAAPGSAAQAAPKAGAATPKGAPSGQARPQAGAAPSKKKE